MNQNRKIHESFSWLMCFPLVCWPLSAALLRKNLVMRMRELRKEEENVRGAGGGGAYERREFFSLLEQRENCILWKTNASKQSRGEADGNGKEDWKG